MHNFTTYLKLLGAVTAWGGTFIAAKFAVLDTSIEMAALLRFITASIVLLILLYSRQGYLPRIDRQQLIYLILLGLSGVAIYNLFFFFGLQSVEAGRGALIITSNPLLVALGSALFYRQRFLPVNLLGLLLCPLGVAVVLSRGELSDLFVQGVGRGELALLGCALSWAAYTLIGKQMMVSKSPLDPLTLVTYSCISGSLLLGAWIILSGHAITLNLTFTLISSIGYLALLGTVAGFIWYFQGIREIGATQGAAFVFFVPVSAILLGHVWLDEAITVSLISGAILIIGGVALTNIKPFRA